MSRQPDIVFLDFEASSLGKDSYPIEVGWVFASGQEESYLIRPAPSWTDWSAESEATHRLTRERLLAEGTPHDEVANHMLEALSGHALFATAPSWDGQWLSKLLRGAGLPRHALRLQDTDVAHQEVIARILQESGLTEGEQAVRAKEILARARLEDEAKGDPDHRALADAKRELRLWRDVQKRAKDYVRGLNPGI
ncbi:transcriptional regulator [Microvirga makkahensis]|uniref:Transcriptional regulator n=1 Tax=Microvirga makkahensis TaxID=1128670 RepID=A0A7X3SM79_9HYPH|nr:transcriptional regulator [Microvirga makkahensis]MXQ10082.1 transcriptional regulator [Microvirga makkahensis]